MKFKARRHLLCLSIFLLIITSCNSGKNLNYQEVVNNDIHRIESFELVSSVEYLNSSVQGTVFVKKDSKDNVYLQLISRVNVDPNDEGGVSFYVPYNWHIEDITSSYPEDQDLDPSDYVATWKLEHSEEKKERWSQWIEIGKNRDNTMKIGG